eukprot:jgi/Ulvmu1/9381/UM051_0008.1
MRIILLALVVLCGLDASTVQAADDDNAAQETMLTDTTSKPTPLHLSYGRVYTESHANGDLPQLPINRSPMDSSWSNSVAICAVSKMDNTTDLREWVQYHRWLGVEHIYLADTGDEPNAALPHQLRDFVKDGFVTLREDAGGKSRTAVYYDCMVDHRHKYNWIAFIDTDEFIVVRKPNSTLGDMLNNFKLLPGLAVHLLSVGSSGRSKRPWRGGVLRLYKQCNPRASPTVKTIANTYFLANIAPHPHNMEFRGDSRAVNERMTPAPWKNITQLPHECQSFIAPTSLRLKCRPIPGASVPQVSIEHIVLFHYITQSAEDFPRKVHHFAAAGDGDENAWQFFNEFQKTASSKEGVCQEASLLADSCCSVPPFKYALPP